MVKSVLITGANSGLGKESARQLALLGTEKIYLGCRNESKAIAAKQELEEVTGKSVFEILLIDVSKPDSVRAAVDSLPEPVEALVMNAGGMGGSSPGAKTSDGVIQIFAVNVSGHVILLDELLKAKKLTGVALYAGSEAARGVPDMGMKPPALATSSVDEFASIVDGTYFGNAVNGQVAYGYVKYMAALWMSSEARKNPDIRFVTMSPGGTSGTSVFDDLPAPMRIVLKAVGIPIMSMMGLMHDLPTGAKRYVDGLNDSSFKTGIFYASPFPKTTGKLIDQATIFADLNNENYQDNASEAIHRFIS